MTMIYEFKVKTPNKIETIKITTDDHGVEKFDMIKKGVEKRGTIIEFNETEIMKKTGMILECDENGDVYLDSVINVTV